MNARFGFILAVAVSTMLSGCVAYSSIGGQYSPTGTDDLMIWAQGAGGTVKHERKVRCVPDRYGMMRCNVTESASSRNIKRGVPPAVSGGPVVYIEKGQPDSVPVPTSNPYSGIKIK